MSTDTIDFVKNGKLTSFYFKLLEQVNNKLDKKIDVLSDKIVEEYENKKAELSKLKAQLDDYNKIKLSIDNINKFYSFNKADNKQIKNISSIINNNPAITTKNLLDTLEDISVKIVDGDFIQLSQNTTITPSTSLLLKDTDNMFKTCNRLMIKKKNVINNINPQTVSFETGSTRIIIDFNHYRVSADEINIRYLTFNNENKATFSYINNILGSNDSTNWEPITQINLAYLRNFEKTTLFKYPAMIKNSTHHNKFYKYLSFESLPSKEVIPKIHINKLLNRIDIPICNFEIFGNYYSVKTTNIVSNLDNEFKQFFESYINSTYEEVSNKVEFNYILNMMLEGFKELTNVITHFKVDNAMKTVSIDSSNNSEQDKSEAVALAAEAAEAAEANAEALAKAEALAVAEAIAIKTGKEIYDLDDSESDIELDTREEKQNIDDNYLDNLMNGEDESKKTTKKKIIKIFDTESNTIDIENNTNFKGKFGKKKNTK